MQKYTDRQVIEAIRKTIEEIKVPAYKAQMYISKDKNIEDSFNVVVSRDFMDEAYDNFDFYKLQDLADGMGIEIMPCSGATHTTTIYSFSRNYI